MPAGETPPEPWLSFLTELDAQLSEPVELHCFGGFVVTQVYGVARSTADLDYVSLIPNRHGALLHAIAGRGSPLHRKYRVCLDAVTIATPPDSYQTRLSPLFPNAWKQLRLLAMEAHDLALAKLERNYERDRDDVARLARAGHINARTLAERYHEELRPYVIGRTESHDLTLQLWIEAYWP